MHHNITKAWGFTTPLKFIPFSTSFNSIPRHASWKFNGTFFKLKIPLSRLQMGFPKLRLCQHTPELRCLSTPSWTESCTFPKQCDFILRCFWTWHVRLCWKSSEHSSFWRQPISKLLWLHWHVFHCTCSRFSSNFQPHWFYLLFFSIFQCFFSQRHSTTSSPKSYVYPLLSRALILCRSIK